MGMFPNPCIIVKMKNNINAMVVIYASLALNVQKNVWGFKCLFFLVKRDNPS